LWTAIGDLQTHLIKKAPNHLKNQLQRLSILVVKSVEAKASGGK
jgi:hypothetical protein